MKKLFSLLFLTIFVGSMVISCATSYQAGKKKREKNSITLAADKKSHKNGKYR
jgi:hypothetical protein